MGASLVAGTVNMPQGLACLFCAGFNQLIDAVSRLLMLCACCHGFVLVQACVLRAQQASPSLASHLAKSRRCCWRLAAACCCRTLLSLLHWLRSSAKQQAMVMA